MYQCPLYNPKYGIMTYSPTILQILTFTGEYYFQYENDFSCRALINILSSKVAFRSLLNVSDLLDL
jgi:hypothetical protein